MREITADCGSVPQIGIRHENGRTVARISLKSIMDMVESHPGGSYTLAYRRRLDDQFYVSDDFTVADGYLEWTVGSHALAVAGDVTVQVSYATGSITAETPQMRFTVGKSIFNGENGQGENLSDLVEQAITAVGQVDGKIAEAEAEMDAAVAEKIDGALGGLESRFQERIDAAIEEIGEHVDLSGKADKADTVLLTTLSRGRKENSVVGERSFAFGNDVTASGNNSHAEGQETVASGVNCHAEGNYTTASENTCHAEGLQSTASGSISHAEGNNTTASGAFGHSEGSYTKASGLGSHAEGISTTASKRSSHAEGNNTTASANQAHAEGDGTTASGTDSHAEGGATKATAMDSHAEGSQTEANGANSHAEGGAGIANGANSHVEGWQCQTTVQAGNAHAEGVSTTASGANSHAEGASTTASGANSHAEGTGTVASGSRSHAEGTGTVAYGMSQHAQGRYNQSHDPVNAEIEAWEAGKRYDYGDVICTNGTVYGCLEPNSDDVFTARKWSTMGNSKVAFMIGNGVSNDIRHTGFAILWDGSVMARKKIVIGNTTITESQLQALLALLN